MIAKTRSARFLPSLFLLFPLFFAACGSGSGGPQTLHVLIGSNAEYASQQKQWMAQTAAAFKKETGANIAWDTYSSISEAMTKLQTSMISGSGPDVFSLGASTIPTAESTKGFTTLTDQDWQAVGGKSRYFPQQLTMAGSSTSNQIAVPWVMRPYTMVYNTTLFKKAGITAPPTTWTQFIQDAQKMTNPSAGVYGTEMDPSDSFDPWKIWWTFAMQEGQNFVSPNLQTAEVNTPDVVNSVQFWFDWATKYHIVDPNSMSWQTSNAQQAFENGKVGMLVEVTPTVNPELESSSVKGDYAFAPMPSIPYGMTQRPAGGVPDETSVSGDMLSVASYSNEKTLAFKFINFLTSTPQQLQWTKTFGDLPANVQAANQLESSDPQIKAFLQAEQSATPVPMTGAWGSLEVALGGVSSKIANQIATNSYNPSNVQSLMNQANTTIQGQLKQQQQ